MTISIRQIIKGPAIVIQQDDDLALALQVMAWSDVRHLPVVSGDKLLGVISERDLLRCYAERGRPAAAREKVGAIMHSPPVTIAPDADLAAAMFLVIERGIGCLPVVERGRLLGIVTRTDLLAAELGAAASSADEAGAAMATTWGDLMVDHAMSTEPATATTGDSLASALERMDRHGVRHLPVVDGERRVIGILSDRDIRTVIGNPIRALSSHDSMMRIESVRVAHVMTRSPITLYSGTPLSRAASVFADHKIGVIPIVGEHERLRGVLSYADVLRAILGPKRTLN